MNVWLQRIAVLQTLNCVGDESWKNTLKRHFVGFQRNFLSPALLPLERPEGVPVDPLTL